MSQEIHDLIQTCKIEPSEETIRRLADICEKLDERIDKLEVLEMRYDLHMKRLHGIETL